MTHILQRRDTAATWTSLNPVLMEGESGHERDTGREKMGDGTTAWVDLPYKYGVDSVAGKTGEVDLVVADVDGAAPLVSPTFTGNPTAPTPNPADDDTSIATTAFVKSLDYVPESAMADAIADAVATAVAATKLAMNPVGTIYESTDSANPSTFIGGTWEAFGAGRVTVAIDAGQTEFDSVTETGGEKTHLLTVEEIPDHYHVLPMGDVAGDVDFTDVPMRAAGPGDIGFHNHYSELVVDGTYNSALVDNPQAHNNLQPYVVVYRFRRTA